MAKIKGTIEVDIERCKGCGVCIEVCPPKVITLGSEVNSKGYRYCEMLRPSECVGCANCAVVCPDSCITVFRRVEKNV